ncbi:MAG: nitrilase-related carbon-nitrogen hydrolase, partial [Albimonas sp.]|uniref:nitrilase-related carbon-nitrogen hydrolase n=1 Tax=Albimonas sp. TaxID=1872425 RepID=UPI004056516A
MPRKLIVAGAQLGPIARDESRASAVARLCALMRRAKARGAELVVFPELALTTFFPRWWMEDPAEIDAWFETEMPNADVAPLFALARELGIGFHLGYAEKTPEGRHFNTAI